MEPIKKEVRAKIVEVCPELMELSFGCVIRNRWASETNPDRDYVLIGRNKFSGISVNTGRKVSLSREKGTVSKIDILGHPPQLHHVLRAMRSHPFYKTQCIIRNEKVEKELELWLGKQESTKYHPLYWEKTLLFLWDMEKDLEGQSDECWKFLHGILVA